MKKVLLFLLVLLLIIAPFFIFNRLRSIDQAKRVETFNEHMQDYIVFSGEYIVDKNLDLQKYSHEDNPCLKKTDIQYLDKLPSSKKLVVLTRVAICITDDQGDIVLNTTVKELTNNKELGFNYAEISPDGKNIILASDWSSFPYLYEYVSKEVTKIDLAKANMKHGGRVFFSNISWGKDELLYFAAGNKIESLNTKSKEISTIIDNAFRPSISKNGKLLAYVWENHLYVVELETKNIIKKLNTESDKYFSNLGLEYFNWVDDNYILISGHDEVLLFCTGATSGCHDTFLYLYSVENNELTFINKWDELSTSAFKAVSR